MQKIILICELLGLNGKTPIKACKNTCEKSSFNQKFEWIEVPKLKGATIIK